MQGALFQTITSCYLFAGQKVARLRIFFANFHFSSAQNYDEHNIFQFFIGLKHLISYKDCDKLVSRK